MGSGTLSLTLTMIGGVISIASIRAPVDLGSLLQRSSSLCITQPPVRAFWARIPEIRTVELYKGIKPGDHPCERNMRKALKFVPSTDIAVVTYKPALPQPASAVPVLVFTFGNSPDDRKEGLPVLVK